MSGELASWQPVAADGADAPPLNRDVGSEAEVGEESHLKGGIVMRRRLVGGLVCEGLLGLVAVVGAQEKKGVKVVHSYSSPCVRALRALRGAAMAKP